MGFEVEGRNQPVNLGFELGIRIPDYGRRRGLFLRGRPAFLDGRHL